MADLLKNIPHEINTLHIKVKKLLKKNVVEIDILKELKEENVSEDYTRLIILNVQSELRDRNDIFKLIFLATFIIAEDFLLRIMWDKTSIKNSAGFMLIFWGIMVMAIILFIKAAGLYKNMPRYKKLTN